MEYRKPEQTAPIVEVNARELYHIEFIAGLDCQLINAEKYLETRLKLVPDAWRQYRIARAAVQKTLVALYQTVPIKTLRHMQNLCTYGEVIIKPRGATPTNDVQIVPTPELKLLINKVIENECAMCVKSYAEQRGCKLRKALMHIAPPLEIDTSGCNYRNVAASNELGEYF